MMEKNDKTDLILVTLFIAVIIIISVLFITRNDSIPHHHNQKLTPECATLDSAYKGYENNELIIQCLDSIN